MLQVLLLAAALLQDPPPPAKTVEERLKELADKIEALDKKAAALTEENQKLQQKLEEGRAMREKFARQAAASWVKRNAAAVEFTEKQSAELEELWFGWSKEDLEKPYDAARWKTREETLRGRLTADQAPRLAKKVREDQEQTAKMSIASFSQGAKLPPDKAVVLEKAVLPKLSYEEGVLIPQAHPDKLNVWSQVIGAVESSLPDLTSSLTEDELAGLRKVLAQWKPRQR
ncbi:MAG: hypothetical protein HY293_20575 [Planctomycetes bacterium]|nr:hypothetical protein [Planctomycetota bacterium]